MEHPKSVKTFQDAIQTLNKPGTIVCDGDRYQPQYCVVISIDHNLELLFLQNLRLSSDSEIIAGNLVEKRFGVWREFAIEYKHIPPATAAASTDVKVIHFNKELGGFFNSYKKEYVPVQSAVHTIDSTWANGTICTTTSSGDGIHMFVVVEGRQIFRDQIIDEIKVCELKQEESDEHFSLYEDKDSGYNISRSFFNMKNVNVEEAYTAQRTTKNADFYTFSFKGRNNQILSLIDD